MFSPQKPHCIVQKYSYLREDMKKRSIKSTAK